MDFGDPYPGEPASIRPALVLGPSGIFGNNFPFVVVAPMTTTKRALVLHVEVEPTPRTGLRDASYVQCELLRSVGRRRLVERLGTVDSVTMDAVDRVVRRLLGH